MKTKFKMVNNAGYLQGYKATNLKAIFDNEGWLIVDQMKKSIMQSDISEQRAKANALYLQAHADKYNHKAQYIVVERELA